MSLLVAALALAACESSPEEGPKPADPADPAAKNAPAATPSKSNIERIPIAVPYGRQVACADVIDAALFSRYIGDEIGEVRDRAKSNSESSLTCGLMRAGKPPRTDAQLRKFQREGMKLGVLPGDEYCLVTAYCSMATDDERFKKKCEDDKDIGNESVGQFACVHTTQRGTKEAYTYRVIDPDTKCILEVMGGPSVTDEPLVQNCTRAALEDITSADLAKSN
ncbi:MAG TPA: hypothetical protein VNO33_24100 [Kofleriaceae bacterium]|nr:hypothetical protein [Kofleriaceae bacterium]